MTITTYALPCQRCGGPVPLDEPEPPGTLALHFGCADAAFELGGRLMNCVAAAAGGAAAAWEARAEADRQRQRAARARRPTCRWAVVGYREGAGERVVLSESCADRDDALARRDALAAGGVEGYASLAVEAVKDVF